MGGLNRVQISTFNYALCRLDMHWGTAENNIKIPSQIHSLLRLTRLLKGDNND